MNTKHNYQIKIIALARNKTKSESLFSDLLQDENFEILYQDVCNTIDYAKNIDYIIHAAGAASPYAIIHDPVGIVQANTMGTFNVLELARSKNTEKVLFTSTREVYGKIEDLEYIKETDFGTIDPLEDRSCYPESKRMAETILKSYELQYGISFCSTRIAHSYGPGMNLANDGRIMSDLMYNIVNNEDIILKSTGEAIRAFCYITDAVKALYLTLLEGKSGEAYNIANETEPISIKELAGLLVSSFPEKKLKIEFIIPESNKGYTNYKRTALDTTKLESLGWKPSIQLTDGIVKTINSF